jgi:hypothetical protein
VTEDDCEALAQRVIDESGLDDRPNADPRILATAWAELELRPEPHCKPHIADGVIHYPAGAELSAVGYFVAHEMGHDILRWAGERLPYEEEERAASRIGSALLLPRRAFLRDLDAHAWDLAALRDLWPLASLWVLARRTHELRVGAAALFSPSGRCRKRLGALTREAQTFADGSETVMISRRGVIARTEPTP